MKKILGLALAAVLMIGLVACGGSTENGNGAEPRGTITMGTNAEFPPFEFISGGQIVGIDVAISRAIADRLGKDLVIEDMPFGILIQALANGEVDFVAAGMTATGTIGDERRETVDFSMFYYRAVQAIIVADNNNNIQSAADLQGRNVAAIAGYTGYAVSRDVLNIQNLTAYRNPAIAVVSLQQNNVEAIVIDYSTARAIVNSTAGLRVVLDEEVFGNEYYAIAVRRGNTELLDVINEVLQELMDSGELDSIIAHYKEYAEEN